MERDLVIGASGGIGAALLAQARPGALGLSRRDHGLDITDEVAISRVLGALQPGLDRVMIATGALEIGGIAPEKSLRALGAANLMAQFAVNAMGPALLIKHLLPLLPRDRPVRLGVLSARVGSIGDNRLGGWHSYRAAKAALNQLVRGAAIELARSHPRAVLVVLHPGTVATPLTARHGAGHPQVTPEIAAARLWQVLDGLSPADSGGFFDWAGKPVPW